MKRNQKSSLFFRWCVLIFLIAGWFSCANQPEVEFLTLADGDVSIRHEGRFYTFRRNQWSFYSWIHGSSKDPAQRRPPRENHPPVLIHFDAHSDMHPAPVCAEPESLRAGSFLVAEEYTRRLSIGTFILPALYYGVVQEVYWVQPPISPYRGETETIRFDLEAQDGWIRIAPRAGAIPLDSAAWTVRSYRGEEVPRCLDVEVAANYPAEDWAEGPYTLHCLSFERLLDLVESGRFKDCETVFNLDLDYFGTSGSLRGYGYLAFSEGSHIALGSMGGILPVFYRSLRAQEDEALRVRDLIRRLSPGVVAVAESPDHTHRGMIPDLEEWIETDLLPGSRSRPVIGSVSLRAGGLGTALSPDCPVSVNLCGAESFSIDVSRGPNATGALEIVLYFNPGSSDDRLIWRKELAVGKSSVFCPISTFFSDCNEPLGAGWDLEIRSASNRSLLWSSGFCLDDEGWLMRSVVEDLVQSGCPVIPDPQHYVMMAPSKIIEAGRRAGLIRSDIQKVLLAHPGLWEHQCRNLRSFRARGGLVVK